LKVVLTLSLSGCGVTHPIQSSADIEADRCDAAVLNSLADDTRFLGEEDYPAEESDRLHERYEALFGKQQQCVEDALSLHQAAVFDACERHGCGDEIAGGCHHIAGYAVSDRAIDRAMATCKQ
jgi:hypothetical protein